MTIFWCVIAGLIWFSYVRAKDRGVPWFSAGKTQARPRRRTRTHSIKPQTTRESQKANQKSSEEGKPRQRLRTHSIKPQGTGRSTSSLTFADKQALNAAFHRLNELTHSQEVSRRMVNYAAERNQDRDELWCIEKAIWDVERDRMAR